MLVIDEERVTKMPEDNQGSHTQNANPDPYEVLIGNTTFRVISRYIGDKPLVDVIKAAIKRDVENALDTIGVDEEIDGDKPAV